MGAIAGGLRGEAPRGLCRVHGVRSPGLRSRVPSRCCVEGGIRLRSQLILSSLAIVSLLIGLWFAPEAAGPRRVTVPFTIPAGANLLAGWGFDVLRAGPASGRVAGVSGG